MGRVTWLVMLVGLVLVGCQGKPVRPVPAPNPDIGGIDWVGDILKSKGVLTLRLHRDGSYTEQWMGRYPGDAWFGTWEVLSPEQGWVVLNGKDVVALVRERKRNLFERVPVPESEKSDLRAWVGRQPPPKRPVAAEIPVLLKAKETTATTVGTMYR